MGRYSCQMAILCIFGIFSAAAFGEHHVAGQSGADERNESVLETAANSWRERRLSYGKSIYEQACASCHDEGLDGAPAIGDRKEWSTRSPLWLAVLLEHAKNGFLGMPAKGGDTLLSDRAVDAAGEYMLSVTFPEKPLD